MANGGKHKDGLDQEALRLLSFETMPTGVELDALITEVTPAKTSCPLGIQVSPFVFSQILFSDCVSLHDLKNDAQAEQVIRKKYRVGQVIKVVYTDSRFVLADMKQSASKKNYKKGDLVVARFIKSAKSFGITVQVDWKNFGTIELCEITDRVMSNMLG